MMNFEEFVDYVKTHIKSYLPDNMQDATIRINQQPKPGQTLTALNIVNPNVNISPNFYLDPLYILYEDGTRTISDIMQMIVYHPCWNRKGPDSNTIHQFTDWEFAKNRIVYRLISNNDIYKPYLNNRIVRDFGVPFWSDIVMIFDLDVTTQMDEDDDMNASAGVTHDLMQMWNVHPDDIYNAAVKNTPLLRPLLLEDMVTLMENMMEIGEDFPDMHNPKMLVISNQKKLYGAVAILYPDTIRKLREMAGEDVYIIPSSVHEFIALPQSFGDPKEIFEINDCVNSEQLSSDEFLSNDVFVWDDELQTLRSVVLAIKYKEEYDFQHARELAPEYAFE